MSVVAWIGLIWLYLMGLGTFIGAPGVIVQGKVEASVNKSVAGIVLAVLGVLATIAVWSSSSFAWATATLVVLLALKACDTAMFLSTVRKGSKPYPLSHVLFDLAWAIAELVLISLLAFA